MRNSLLFATLIAAATADLAAQTPLRLQLADGQFECRVHEPPARGPDGFAPLALVCGEGSDAIATALAAAGCVAVTTGPATPPTAVPTALRQRFAITRGGIHLVARGAAVAAALQLAVAAPWEFQSVTAIGAEARQLSSREAARLGSRPVVWLAPAEADAATAVAAQITAVRAKNEPTGAVGEVAHVLDRFHDAAAKGDEDVYFALLPEDAVFLGTDATERWTGAEFRAFALPYFQRGPAWIYVPTRRTVTLLTADTAMFDELLDNEAYGECRGSGVLERRDGRWVVRLYDLSVPVPNDLARAFVARIRAFAAAAAPPRGTIVVVRHAEKVTDGSDDPELSAAGTARAERLAALLADVPIAAVFATEFRRTQATVAPLATARGLTPRIAKAADTKALARTLRSEFATATTVVAAHSNTIPALLKDLGIAERFPIADDDYSELLVITLDSDGTHLLRLHVD